MPSISRGVLCLGCVVFAVQGQTITNRPIFIGREPLTGSQKTTFLDLFAASVAGPRPSNFVFPARNVLLANPIIDPRVTAKYREVVANKSLLINDCDSFCDDPFFSFGRIVERAANATAIPHPEKTAGDWYNGLDGVVPDYRNHVKPWSGSNSDQFQLLAVVNRLDMATPGVGDTWVGAELRFVYGARTVSTQTGPEPFSVIVEFVLPALHWKDFRGMAGAWHDLRRLQGAAFVTQLKTLLQEARSPVSDKAKVNCSPLVRIRTNSVSGSGGAPWFFAQWELFKGKLRQTLLNDELYRQCTRIDGQSLYLDKGCPQTKPTSCRAYLPLYSQFEQHPGLSMEIGWTELRPRTQCYNVVVDTGMDGPAGYCSTDPKAAPFGIIGLARKVVALQQCSNCHGAETNNQDFFHIANRMPDSHEAKLSPFLMGGSDPKPSEEDINNEKENAVYTAHVSVTWPGSGDCPKAAVPIDRHYNDIARRSLFLAAVLVNDASTLPDLGLSDIIRSYGPNMTH